MFKIYRKIAALLAAVFSSTGAPDPLASLSMHDWADLPAFHPMERQDCCGCRE